MSVSVLVKQRAASDADPVIAAVERWWGDGLALDAPADRIEQQAKAFPYDLVHAHWLRCGRAKAEDTLVRLVDLIGRSLAVHDRPAPGTWSWFLESWLQMLVDIPMDRCSYATYVGTDVVKGLTVPEPDGPLPPAAEETVVGLLLALLLRHEAGESIALDRSLRRVTVVANALLQHRCGLLDRVEAAALWPPAHLPGASPAATAETTADAAQRLADRAVAAAPPWLVQQLDALVVPVTTEHDEIMFLRTLQLFETVLFGMLEDVRAAQAGLAQGDTAGAASRLADAATSLRRSMAFFRIVGTMPADRFAVIRVATTGASGLQSEAFKRIELLCAEQPVERLGSLGYTEPNVAAFIPELTAEPSIEEHAAALLDGRATADPQVARLLGAMDGLDRAWLQWKKTHWAIATRLIGQLPGTGGTEGTQYLRAHMSGPLFPSLHT